MEGGVMKEKITGSSAWTPTMQLRWIEKSSNPHSPYLKKVLQQLWRNNLCIEEWRDIELVIENKPQK